MLSASNRAVSVLSGAYFKFQCYVFLRMLPLGYRFLPRISASLCVFLASFALQTPMSPSSVGIFAPLLGVRTSSRRAAILAVGINLLPVIFIFDFLYRAHVFYPSADVAYSRTGFVNSTSAKVVLRHPAMASAASAAVILTWRGEDGLDEKSINVPGGFDGVATVQLVDLTPATAYWYTTSLNHSGSFTTSPSPENDKVFRFISTSCLKPFYPYSPFSHALNIAGILHLASFIRTEGKLDWIFFLGDWIYIDLPISLEPHYTELFRQIYASPDWTQELRDVPWLHAFDDHELINDYYPGMDPQHTMYEAALAPFRAYQGHANPDDHKGNGESWYTFRRGDASFFVLDTRSARSTPPAKEDSGFGKRTMLGAKQLSALKAWIRGERGWKVIVSGVPFTRNWSGGGDEMDSWAGYLDEREEILALLWEVGGGIIVSGDRHEHATVKFPPPVGSGYPTEHAVIEFSTSPLSFFFQPFVREYLEHAETDVTIYQHPKGSSKFGVFDFDSSGAVWTVRFALVVDGVKSWEYMHRWEPSIVV